MLTTVGSLHHVSLTALTGLFTQEMIRDLMADSKRWDEEVRRSRNRGTRQPGRQGDLGVNITEISNGFAAYEDTEIHERRQITGPTGNPAGYPAPPPRMRERDDYDMMDEYGRQPPPSQRTFLQGNMQPDYMQNYPVTSGPFQTTSVTAPPEYVLARGQAEGFGQVPRSQYEMYSAGAAGRGVTLQSPNQGQFASQQGMQSPPPYMDPRTGQMVYPPAGRGFDPAARHPGSTDRRR
jgi:hypothetical protein